MPSKGNEDILRLIATTLEPRKNSSSASDLKAD